MELQSAKKISPVSLQELAASPDSEPTVVQQILPAVEDRAIFV